MVARKIKAHGRKVGAATRKVRLHGRLFLVPKFDEKLSGVFVADKRIACYRISQHSATARVRRMFDVVRAYLPNNVSQEFLVVDRYGFVEGLGKRDLLVRKITDSNRLTELWKDIGTSLGSKNVGVSNVMLWEVLPSINPKKFFREYGDRWLEILDCYVTEGLEKDPRLIDWFKAMVLPLVGRAEYWQPYNPHSLLLCNTGTGKTFFNKLLGQNTSLDCTSSGLFGSNVDTEFGRRQEVGVLSSTDGGFFMMDEFELMAGKSWSATALDLLSYMEEGTVERILSKGVNCEGTKTICFSSNPQSGDYLESFVNAMKLLQGVGDPTRFGRRFGFFLMGDDFMRIEKGEEISILRDPVRRIIHFSVIKEKTRYIAILKALSREAKKKTSLVKAYENTLRAASKSAVDETTKKFILGLSMSAHKLKMAALLIGFLENFNHFMLVNDKKSVLKKIVKSHEATLERLFKINTASVEKLIITDRDRAATPENAKKLRERFPSLSSRQIAVYLGCSHTTVDEYLKDSVDREKKPIAGDEKVST